MATYKGVATSKDELAPVNLLTFGNLAGGEDRLENMLRSVVIIPATTEFGYGTTIVSTTRDNRPLNAINNGARTDFERSIEQLLYYAPNLEHVSLVVAWHGDDLRMGNCEIKPKVETNVDKTTTPYAWNVGGVDYSSAELVSSDGNGHPRVGGAPSDRTVVEAIQFLRSKGLDVTLYPFIIVDVPPTNNLPDPHNPSNTQPAMPWRGRITCYPAAGVSGSPDGTTAVNAQVDAFFGAAQPNDFAWDASAQHVTFSGAANEWSFRRHILHLAKLAEIGGATDFLIGSEMGGITSVRNGAKSYPVVAKLKALAADVRSMLGGSVKISYAADWSEYHSHKPHDAPDVLNFPLDALWSDSNIDYIGIDNYLPLSDWREGGGADATPAVTSVYVASELARNIEGGEYYDWYYASQADRDAQNRTPIEGNAQRAPFYYQQKNIREWWENDHYELSGYQPTTTKSAWIAQSKPVVFTELGCAAIHNGSNEPNAFVDPNSVESRYPRYSKGYRDDHLQRSFLEAHFLYWRSHNPSSTVYWGEFLDMSRMSIWCWDARPYPEFPKRTDYWTDGANYGTGHWLNGRLIEPPRSIGVEKTVRLNDSDREVEFLGQIYSAIPTSIGKRSVESRANKSNLELEFPVDQDLLEMLKDRRPTSPIYLQIDQVSEDGNGGYTDAAHIYSGIVVSTNRSGDSYRVSVQPLTTTIAAAGLRQNYQITCPYVVYGTQCRADKVAATLVTSDFSLSNKTLQIAPSAPSNSPILSPIGHYLGGTVEWVREDGQRIIRRIAKATNTRKLKLIGSVEGLADADEIIIVKGCDRSVTGCRDIHNNVDNFGGCPHIPIINPMSPSTNNYY